MMKQSKGLNGDLKPEHKNTTNKNAIDPIADTDSQAPTIWNTLKREPSFGLMTGGLVVLFKREAKLSTFSLRKHAYSNI